MKAQFLLPFNLPASSRSRRSTFLAWLIFTSSILCSALAFAEGEVSRYEAQVLVERSEAAFDSFDIEEIKHVISDDAEVSVTRRINARMTNRILNREEYIHLLNSTVQRYNNYRLVPIRRELVSTPDGFMATWTNKESMMVGGRFVTETHRGHGLIGIKNGRAVFTEIYSHQIR